MSKLLSILLSTVILLQSLGLHANDVAQLDEFIAHATFHSEQYGDNVLVFISKHYGDLKVSHEQEHQEEKEDHEKLPFQHLCHSLSAIDMQLTASIFTPNTMEVMGLTSFNFYYSAPSSTLHTQGILQPPRGV